MLTNKTLLSAGKHGALMLTATFLAGVKVPATPEGLPSRADIRNSFQTTQVC